MFSVTKTEGVIPVTPSAPPHLPHPFCPRFKHIDPRGVVIDIDQRLGAEAAEVTAVLINLQT